MRSVAFFNNKGGVGKTTLLCNIASFLSIYRGMKVLVVDADPQCNATQLILSDIEVNKIYSNKDSYTINSIVHPLSLGKGYNDELKPRINNEFGVDLICGDPALALKEDLLSSDWQHAISGGIRGLRTTFLFRDLLIKCSEYDYVFFDVGPSLGSINRSVLLASDGFLSPMSIDIFSLKAIENITTAINEWKRKLELGVAQIDSNDKNELNFELDFSIEFIGYVAQQYNQKTTKGERRAVKSYDEILKQIPGKVKEYFVDRIGSANNNVNIDYAIGRIPNLYSLVPMAQSARKPVFELKSKDGVRGAHFSKVEEAKLLFEKIADHFTENCTAIFND